MDGLGRALRRRMLSGQTAPWRGEVVEATTFHSTVAGDTLWFGLRRPDRKLLVGRTSTGALAWESYDLVADPGERHSLLPDRMPPSGAAADSLGGAPRDALVRDEVRLLEWAAEVQQSLQEPPPTLSEEARERLRGLGYIR
jgi:hypothetical protein